MGCVTSKADINDLHPNVFQVINVDEMCTPLHPGQLEVSETDLVLHQRGKTPVRWPIKSLRRYGFDAHLFSFECGRRCPTGPGIFAFKCTRAEQLFNLLQTQMRNNPGDDTVSNTVDFTPRQTESNYLEPAPLQIRHNGNRVSIHYGRLSSVGSSNGPLSPLATSPSPPPPTVTDDGHRALSHSYSNSTAITELSSPPGKEPPPPPHVATTYANIDITPTSPVFEEATHTDYNPSEEGLSSPVYMNVIPGQEIVTVPAEAPPTAILPLDPESRHCYANLELGEIESKYSAPAAFQLSRPSTPPAQINYILLDLDQTSSTSSLTGPGPLNSPVALAPDSPVKPSEGYATIDFDRTVALGSVTCPMIDDDGSRKTRHNSTMSELTAAEEKEKEVKRTRHNSTIGELMAPLTARLSSSLSE